MGITRFCKELLLQHRESVRDEMNKTQDEIKRSAAPLAGEAAERPFGIPKEWPGAAVDIWHCVLQYITDPSDILTLWEVCPLFQDILNYVQIYIQTQLPQIIQILVKKRPQFLLSEQERLIESGRYVYDVRPSTKVLLSLRCISRRCKESVEELLHKEDHGKLILKLDTEQKVNDLIDSILGKEIEPASFFPRNLELSDRLSWLWLVWSDEAAGVLLELVGERILTFSYDCCNGPDNFYSNLREWAIHLPNLQTLEISAGIGAYSLRCQRRAMPKLKKVASFPHLPHLRAFVDKTRFGMQTVYVRHILMANPGIRTLDQSINVEEWDMIPPTVIKASVMQLECLHVPGHKSLLAFLKFRMPLKEIILREISSIFLKTTSQVLSRFLEQFKDTLEHLEVHIEVEYDDGGSDFFLDLPHLKVFKWRYHKSFKDLRFLLHAPRLEVIQALFYDGWSIRNKDLCSKRFFNKMKKSFGQFTVWDMFPRLRKLVAQFKWGGQCVEVENRMT